MGKDAASWETIEKLLLEGYKPRIKTSKGKLYLSARKGGDEKGLGSYDEEIWKKIQGWKKEDIKPITDDESNTSQPEYTISLFSAKKIPTPVEAKFSKKEIEDALFEIKLERARIKIKDCKYRIIERCEYWQFMDDAKQLNKIYEKFNEKIFKMVAIENYERITYHVNELLCLECDKFIPREKEIKNISNENKKIK